MITTTATDVRIAQKGSQACQTIRTNKSQARSRRRTTRRYAASMDEEPREFGFNTRSVHAGQRPDPYTGASATPIYQTAGFVFEDTESASAYFNLQEYGNVYSRIMNPTVAAFEERLANLEGGVGAVAFASGLAAQAGLFFALLEPGDRIAVAKALYGGSTAQLNHLARKLQITVDWVDMDDPDGWRRTVTAETKALFAETIANPGGNVLDISLAAAVAHEVGAPLVVDNTFATPYLCRPLEFGADLIIHSATKFIAGNGTTIAGAVVDSGTFDWSNGRFPSIAEPSTAYHGLKFHETFGVYGLLMKLRAETLRDFGAVLAPFNAFLLLLGIESLAVRMDRHVANALAVAEWLCDQQGVGAVRHPALPDSPYRSLVDRYLPAGAGSVFSFDLESGREGGRRFIEALSLWSHLANVGDTKSLVIHPASTTHRQLSDEELAASGVAPGTVRLSVGLEDVDDLVWDLERGLQAARGSAVTA